MTWPNALSEAFPPPRDDEPNSLRDDIADELADHLEAAFARERSRCNDEAQARQAVLRRFGDPQSVTRRLWFDAMKGEIMTQRILVAAVTLMSLACLSVAGLAWRSVRQSDENNRAVVAQLAEMVKSLKKESGEELVDLEVQCVLDKPDGSPAEGCTVNISGPAINAGETATLNGISDESGKIRFTAIRAGVYHLGAKAASGWSSIGQRVMVPRTGNRSEQVVCPSAPPVGAEVVISAEWPEEYRDKELTLVAMVAPIIPKIEEQSRKGWHWNLNANFPPHGAPKLALNQKNQFLESLALKSPMNPGEAVALKGGLQAGANKFHWLDGSYSIAGLGLVEPSTDTIDKSSVVMTNIASIFYRESMRPEFTAVAGRENHWIIKVPPIDDPSWRRPKDVAKAEKPNDAPRG